MSTVSTDRPDASWTLDQLAAYVRQGFIQADQTEARADQMEQQVQVFRRTGIITYFRAGQALTIARQHQKAEGTWCKWLEANQINRKTALVAITIYEKAKTEAMASKFTLKRAKQIWCRENRKPRTIEPTPTAKVPTYAETVEIVALQLEALEGQTMDATEAEEVRLRLTQIIATASAMLQRVSPVHTKIAA